MRERDPAARSDLEVLLCYPGLHAVWGHLLAHALWPRVPLFARLLSQFVRFLTGVEIHPGADLGRRVTIDHGAGVVVGETADIGDDVHLYHGVTLGGDTPEPVKRHPTVRDGATIGANATLLGDIEIGENARVGAGAVVTKDVPADATVAGIPAKRVDGGAAPEQGPTTEAETVQDAEAEPGVEAKQNAESGVESASTSSIE